MRFAWVLLLLAWSGAAGAAARPDPAGPDSVHLRFGWKPGMSARVEFEGNRTRTGRDPQQARMAWRLRVAAHDQGLAIGSDSLTVRSGPNAGQLEQFLLRLTAMSPVQLVSPAGEFLGLDRVAEYRAHMLGALDSLLSSSDAPPNVRDAVAGMISEGMLQASAADEWNAIVGFWMDADLEVGETLTSEITSPSPVLPDVQIPQRMEFGATRRVPCADGRAGCVELRLTTVPDVAKARETLAALVGELAPAARDSVLAALENLKVENEVILVTRPDGMFPESVRKVRRSTVQVREAGEVRSVVQSDVKASRWQWRK